MIGWNGDRIDESRDGGIDVEADAETEVLGAILSCKMIEVEFKPPKGPRASYLVCEEMLQRN